MFQLARWISSPTELTVPIWGEKKEIWTVNIVWQTQPVLADWHGAITNHTQCWKSMKKWVQYKPSKNPYILCSTCQVRVVWFYASRILLLPPPRPTDLNSTASARSQCSPPDINCKLVIAVVAAELWAQDQNGPCRTSTASVRSQWSPPDPKASDQSGPCRARTASARSEWSLPGPNSKRYRSEP